MKLKSILGSTGLKDFFERFWGKDFLRVQGEKNKFSHLVTWKDLNNLLGNYPLRHPQVRLLDSDGQVNPEKYIKYQSTRFKGSSPKQKIQPDTIQEILSQGATLVLDGLHEMLPKVKSLAIELERELGEVVQVNGYLGWNGAKGFSTHWDSHDVMVLQVIGSKKWYVHEITRKHPLLYDVEKAPQPENINWQGLLTEGDMLYLPRGYWHGAESVEGPTFHLTIGIKRKTGMDFLRWIVDQLAQEEIVRNNLPRFEWSDEGGVVSHEERLITAMMNRLEDSNLLRKYMNYETSHRSAISASSMPFTVLKSLEVDTELVSNLPRRLIIEILENGNLSVSACGKCLVLPKIVTPILDRIESCKSFTLRDVVGDMSGVPEDAINGTLINMIEIGWIKVL